MKSKIHRWFDVSDNIKRIALAKVFLLLFLLVTFTSTSQKLAAQTQVSFQVFYDQLSPYGTWVDYPNYGYVWQPSGVPGFYPYATGGSWVYSDYGWTWVSDYSWGWAPFHYGRWHYDSFYGWLWVPGNTWGPAWVVWRNGGGYYGWAPMTPGWNVSVSFGYNPPVNYWTFVHHHHFGHHDMYHHYAHRNNNVTIVNNTTIINNTYVDNSRNTTYIAGPHRDQVQKVTGRSVKPVAIRERNQPGQSRSGKEIAMYRPQVQPRGAKGSNAPAPAKFERSNEGKQSMGRQEPVGKPNMDQRKVGEQNPKLNREPQNRMDPNQGKPEMRNPNQRPSENRQQPKFNEQPTQRQNGDPTMNKGREMPRQQDMNRPPQQNPQQFPKGQPDNRKMMPEQRRNVEPPMKGNPPREMQSPKQQMQPNREFQRERPPQRMMNPQQRPPSQGQPPRQQRSPR